MLTVRPPGASSWQWAHLLCWASATSLHSSSPSRYPSLQTMMICQHLPTTTHHKASVNKGIAHERFILCSPLRRSLITLWVGVTDLAKLRQTYGTAVTIVLSALAQDVDTLNSGRANGYVSGQIYYDVVMVRYLKHPCLYSLPLELCRKLLQDQPSLYFEMSTLPAHMSMLCMPVESTGLQQDLPDFQEGACMQS